MEFPDLDQVSLELVIPTPVLTREGKLFLEVVDVVMCVDQLGLERIVLVLEIIAGAFTQRHDVGGPVIGGPIISCTILRRDGYWCSPAQLCQVLL